MRPLILILLLFASPAQAASDCTEPGCLQARLTLAMRHLLGTAPDPARQAEIMTTQVLWQAYRDMQCGLDAQREAACQQRQTRWRLEEIEAGLR